MEESLHPLDHDLVVFPPKPEFLQQFLPAQCFESGAHLSLKVRADRFGVAVVKFGLETFDLLNAKLVNFRIDLHVLFLGEHDVFVPRGEEGLQGLQCVLSQVAPLVREHLSVVNDYSVLGHTVCGWFAGPRILEGLLRHHV